MERSNANNHGHDTTKTRGHTSLAKRQRRSLNMAIASCAAPTLPRAGIRRVLLDPGVGYFETAKTRAVGMRRRGSVGRDTLDHGGSREDYR